MCNKKYIFKDNQFRKNLLFKKHNEKKRKINENDFMLLEPKLKSNNFVLGQQNFSLLY